MPLGTFLKLRSYLVELREAERNAYEQSALAADGSEVLDFQKDILGRETS